MQPPPNPLTLPALLVLTVLFITLGYALICAASPVKTCRHCSGLGRLQPRRFQRGWRTCRHCRGHGARIRTGRRAYSTWKRTRTRARNTNHTTRTR